MAKKIHPAGPDDPKTAFEDAAAYALWDIWKELKGTPYLWLVEEVCAGYGILIGDSP